LLYRTARELLANVAKHARAGRLVVTLAMVGDTARLSVADDGVGVGGVGVGGRDGLDLGHRLGEGHIGLASHALRVEAAGGTLTVAPGATAGTLATVELPLHRAGGPATDSP
jgi:two-component system NarL family sensor kinase